MKLKQLIAELTQDKAMLQDIPRKKVVKPPGATRWWSIFEQAIG